VPTALRVQDARGEWVDLGPIQGLLARIIQEFRPVEIRLFGSRARGDATMHSDWDLFVVVPDELELPADPFAAGYRLRRETRTRADIVLCSASEYREDEDTPNTLAYEAAHHGVVLPG
jgi:predicted nucleotidyltransferase